MCARRRRTLPGGPILLTAMLLLLLTGPQAPTAAAGAPDLTALLLSEADLPAGWRVWSGMSLPDPLTQPARLAAAANCPELADLAPPLAATARQTFIREHGQLADTIEQAVAAYAPGEARPWQSALDRQLAACAGRGRAPTGATGPSGTPVEAWVTPLPELDVGEGALIYATGEVGDFTNRDSLLAVVRRGDRVLLLIVTTQSFAQPVPDPEQAVVVLRLAVARLEL